MTLLEPFMSRPRVFLDYAASTPTDPDVLRAMRPYFSKYFGNPGSMHAEGARAKEAYEDARARLAAMIGAQPDEIICTSGGTEANNLAVLGTYAAHGANRSHIITSSIEHPSVLDPVGSCARRGATVSHISVDSAGVVDAAALRTALTDTTLLISIMLVNNEIGSVQKFAELLKVVRKHRAATGSVFPYVHTDASQAPLYYPLNVERLGVDLMTLDAQKLYGPKGVGLLYKRRSVNLEPIMFGGEQEHGLRPGTENVPLVVGMARALELAGERRDRDNTRIEKLRDYFISEIERMVPGAVLNGGREDRVPNNVNISIPGFESSFMVVWLDTHGVACGSRSACIDDTRAPSHVLRAIGASDRVAESSLRFTLGRTTTRADIDTAVRVLANMVKKLTK